jgi:hypothetical protein
MDEAEEAISYNEEMLEDIKVAAVPYLEARANIAQYEKLLKEGAQKSLRVTISNVAASIEVEGPAGVDGTTTTMKLSDQIVFEKEKTKVLEGPSLKKAPKKKKRNSDEEGNVLRVDQEVKYTGKGRGRLDKSGVPISAIYTFLEALENESLLFVTSLKIVKTVGVRDLTTTKTNSVDIKVTTFRAREGD